MKPIFEITEFEEDKTLFHVEIKEGADQINDEIELIELVEGTLPVTIFTGKAIRLINDLWELRILK